MPWTLINFTSPTLDLTNPENFRDLTKPIGALNQHRLFLLQERMKENCHVSKQCNFLYGNHYSTPGYNVYWLSREIPECLLFLQGGRFDTWPRLFHSLNATWSYLQEGRVKWFCIISNLLIYFFFLPVWKLGWFIYGIDTSILLPFPNCFSAKLIRCEKYLWTK
jgi:hypothetical protein